MAILPVGPAFFAPNVAQSLTGVRTVRNASKQPRTETFASCTGVAGFGGKRLYVFSKTYRPLPDHVDSGKPNGIAAPSQNEAVQKPLGVVVHRSDRQVAP